jgi:tight adherence protein B
MYPALGLISLAAVFAATVYGWQRMALRRITLDRLSEPTLTAPALSALRRSAAGPLRRTWWWTPWLAGLVIGIVLFFFLRFWLIYSVAIGLILALLGAELEAYLAQRKTTRIEMQLADAIDLMIGALGAGTGLTSAMAAAIEETRQPLQGQLEDVLGRIRLGDEPRLVFGGLAERVPLETFTLFASALAVHWEVGGSLTPTLAMVGRTIRDRIEIGRRIQSNTAQSQLSTVFIMLLTYFIAAIVWRNNPSQMEAFVGTEMGSLFVAGSIVMQAAGIVWMNWISKPRF